MGAQCKRSHEEQKKQSWQRRSRLPSASMLEVPRVERPILFLLVTHVHMELVQLFSSLESTLFERLQREPAQCKRSHEEQKKTVVAAEKSLAIGVHVGSTASREAYFIPTCGTRPHGARTVIQQS